MSTQFAPPTLLRRSGHVDEAWRNGRWIPTSAIVDYAGATARDGRVRRDRRPMTGEQFVSMCAEIVRGVAKADSRFRHVAEFSETWDRVAAQVEQLRAENPDVVFDIPHEVAG